MLRALFLLAMAITGSARKDRTLWGNSSEVHLPYTRYDQGHPFVVLTHGLGYRDPGASGHTGEMLFKYVEHSARKLRVSVLEYTARGHKHSTGWEATAESDLMQFTWERLADDMILIANNQSIRKFVAGGVSQGAATSLFCSMKYAERVLAVILMRPPTAWESRAQQREGLRRSATAFRDSHPNDPHYLVLEGARLSDLPPMNDSTSYLKVLCPVLILSMENDQGHPTSTARTLRELLPRSTLHIAKDSAEVARRWPVLIQSFLSRVLGSVKSRTKSSHA